MEDIDVYQKFKNQFDQRLKFTSPYDPDEGPIITLTESVSSWNVGDQIVVGRISYFERVEANHISCTYENEILKSVNRL